MTKPTYWSCVDCSENCMVMRPEDTMPMYCLDSDADESDWTEITRDQFLEREKLLNDPSYNVQPMDKTTGLWRKEESPMVIGVDPTGPEEDETAFVPRGTITGRWKSCDDLVDASDSKPEPKFKPGDQARVVASLEALRGFGIYVVCPGEIITIDGYAGDDKVMPYLSNGYRYPAKALEPV